MLSGARRSRGELSRWTEQDVRESKWFGAVAVLSGLEAVGLGLSENAGAFSLFWRKSRDVEVMAANWELVRRLFIESATRPRDPAAVREERSVCRLRVPKRG